MNNLHALHKHASSAIQYQYTSYTRISSVITADDVAGIYMDATQKPVSVKEYYQAPFDPVVSKALLPLLHHFVAVCPINLEQFTSYMLRLSNCGLYIYAVDQSKTIKTSFTNYFDAVRIMTITGCVINGVVINGDKRLGSI